MTCSAKRRQRGFTLAELAIVVLIVGLLLGGFIGTYSTQIELSRIAETKRTLETARDALLGFAAANGRLPCAARASLATDTGVELPAAGGSCTVPAAPLPGYFPAATLGLSPADSQGFLLDSWGNRVRYWVTSANANEFTTSGQLRPKLLDLNPATPGPNLQVCSTSACAAGGVLTSSAAAVIWSVGKNGMPGGAGVAGAGDDEAENLDFDGIFVAHPPAPAGAPGGEFDDIVIWLSPPVLYNRLLSGAL
jgi:prepilin-type N-terminal cleavage/methylation domain-containing protein